MSSPFRVALVAMALIAALGSLPASARGGGGGFHGGGFQGGFNRGFVGPGFNRGFFGPRFGFNRGFVGPRFGFFGPPVFVGPRVFVGPGFVAPPPWWGWAPPPPWWGWAPPPLQKGQPPTAAVLCFSWYPPTAMSLGCIVSSLFWDRDRAMRARFIAIDRPLTVKRALPLRNFPQLWPDGRR